MIPRPRVCLHIFLCFVAGQHSFVASEDEVQVLMCNSDDVVSFSLPHRTLRKLPIYTVDCSTSIDYDPVNNAIYWTDLNSNKLISIQLPNGEERMLLEAAYNESNKYYGVAVDSHLRKVFYTDEGAHYIGVVDMDGNNNKRILNIASPTALTLDQENRKIYFGIAGISQYIAVVNYDGTGVQEVVSLSLGQITGITLDKTEGVLYWSDALRHTIESVFVNGTGRKYLFYSNSSDFTNIYLFGKILYFTDSSRGTLYAMSINGGSAYQVETFAKSRLTGLVVYSNANIPDCPEGRYGVNCIKRCGGCLEPKLCDPITGICLSGCANGYQGPRCLYRCPKGAYGPGCIHSCLFCKDRDCDRFNGNCHTTCLQGWAGPQCLTACLKKNTFGRGCKPCGGCLGQQEPACSPINGNCPGACEEGWYGLQCRINRCPPNTYGLTCKPCGHCAWDEICDIVSGECLCDPRQAGNRCYNITIYSGCTFARSQSLLAIVITAGIVTMWTSFLEHSP